MSQNAEKKFEKLKIVLQNEKNLSTESLIRLIYEPRNFETMSLKLKNSKMRLKKFAKSKMKNFQKKKRLKKL